MRPCGRRKVPPTSLRASHRSAAAKFVQPPRLRRREEHDRALAAFATGALAGMLIRRDVPAMTVTRTAWAGLARATGSYLRRQYEALLATSNPAHRSSRSGETITGRQ